MGEFRDGKQKGVLSTAPKSLGPELGVRAAERPLLGHCRKDQDP